MPASILESVFIFLFLEIITKYPKRETTQEKEPRSFLSFQSCLSIEYSFVPYYYASSNLLSGSDKEM